MLQRQFLDERCTVNDPGRNREKRCSINNLPTVGGRIESPKIEPCHQSNYNNETMAGDDCPKVNVQKEHIGVDEKPPYFPQPEDDIPPKAEGPMGPIGPWATGQPVFSPTTGMTGIRPVVDRYSITRYTPAQWRAHNQTFFDQSTKMINNARTIAKNFRQTNKNIYKETDKNQLENRDRVSTRASEIHHFKTQLERAILELTDEIELLEGEHRRVKQSLSVLIIPENISGEFLQLRCLRIEPDLVRDKVEDELVKEIALYAEIRDLFTQTQQSIEDQLVELKIAKARLEFDITDKIDAYTIESECIGLTNDSPLVMMKPGATRVPPEQSTPEEYQQFTKENLENSENIRQKSITLRANLDATYLKVVKELRSQAIQVDVALAEKVHMTEQICQELEKELVNCLNELTDTEKLIEELRGASRGLNDAMKVAQSRLDYRLQRKNVESCRDLPQYGLIDEVKIIQENLTAMAGQLKNAEETQADLVKSRGNLEREIMATEANLQNNFKYTLQITPHNRESSIKELNDSPHSNNFDKHTETLTNNEFSTKFKKSNDEFKITQSVDKNLLSYSKPSNEITVEGSLSPGRRVRLARQTGIRSTADKDTLSRYNPLEWPLHNEDLSREVKESINDAKNIACDVRLMENEIFNQVDRNKLESDIHLKDKARLIYNWKLELQRNHAETINQIENVEKIIKQLAQSNRAIEVVKNINHDIQQVRNMRVGSDLVHDSASEEIIKEETLCKEVLDVYSTIAVEGKQYVQELKDAKHRLEQDWSNKTDTYNIETVCIGLKSTSPMVQFKPGCATLPEGQFHPLGHEYAFRENIDFNQTAIARARIFCADVKEVINKSVKDLKLQAGRVNEALREKNHYTQRAYRKLEHDLVECLKSISDTEKMITKTSESIRKLDAPMKCAQTRLHIRLNREQIEHCRDIPQFSLIDEVKDISDGVNALFIQIKDAENTIVSLRKSQDKIQNEIWVKQRTLWVDHERCQSIRSFFPSDHDLCGY